MDITWGFVFRKGELECERPQSTYIPEPSVVPAPQKPKRNRSCLSLRVLPWIPREEGSADSTLTTTDYRAGRKEKHLRETEDPNCIHFCFWTSVPPHPHARNNCNLKNSEYFKNLYGQYWNLDAEECSKNSFALLHVETLCYWFFFFSWMPSLSLPWEKNSNTDEDWEEIWKTPKKYKKAFAFHPGKEGS